MGVRSRGSDSKKRKGSASSSTWLAWHAKKNKNLKNARPPAGEVRLTEESDVINIACIVLELQLFLGLLKWEGIGESEFTT